MKEKRPSLLLSGVVLAAALLIPSLFISSCAKAPEPLPKTLAKAAVSHAGCLSFEDEFWDGLHRFALNRKPFPSAHEMREIFEDSIAEGRLKNLPREDQQRIAAVLVELYETLALESLTALAVSEQDFAVVLETLTGLELGDRTTPKKAQLQDKIREKFAEAERIAKASGASATCPPPEQRPRETVFQQAGTLFAQWKAERHPAVYGALKGLATAYQNCVAGKLPSVSSATADVEGISIIGTHSNGVGRKRVVSDLNDLLHTHYYLRSYVKPSSSCFDVTKSPMIYDYGGKPYATTETDSQLNFFRNAGSGTSALGIDCSGYVYSALAAGGLKVKESGRLKAVSVSGINSRMYMNPEDNGLTCLSKVKFSRTSSIKPGDILASTGHVVLVTYVGEDPLGIDSITKESDCNSTNIRTSKFNFTILQSAPVKGGMGIMRMWAKDYFTSGSMASAMVTHAINACKAKIRNTTITTSSSGANLVRHKGTSACMDRELTLSYQSCVASCPGF